MAIGVVRGAIGTCFLALAVPAVGQAPPPPPPPALEFFHPTVRQHSLSAECYGGSTALLAWTFDGKDAVLRTFAFAGRPLPAEQFARFQGWMSEIAGDVLIDIECGGEAASLRIISAQFAGAAATPGIRVNFIGGELSEFARYNFDGKRISGPRR